MTKRKQNFEIFNISKHIKMNENLNEIEKTLKNFGLNIKNNCGITIDQKKFFLHKIKELENLKNEALSIKLLSLNTSDNNKKVIMQYYASYLKLHDHDSEKGKYLNWLLKMSNYPFGKITKSKVKESDSSIVKKKYLTNTLKEMNNLIYGHSETKNELLKLIAQSITNSSNCNIGLCGAAGVGKTEIIKNVFSKILNKKFQFISLSGICDGSYLHGHSFTYTQSICGKIIDAIIEAQSENAIIFFDELDKTTLKHGINEIENILIHLIDPTQNKSFQDLYFQGIEFDVSKMTFIFSFNDESNISRILLDRIKVINVKPYNINDKLIISQKHLIPNILNEIGIKNYNQFITEDIIKHIVYTYTNEHGVRKLRENLKDLLMTYNLNHLLKNNKQIDISYIDKLFKNKYSYVEESLNFENKVGCINGMWANDYVMVGGVIQIETKFVYSTENFKLILTGNAQKIMAESVEIAKTVAWNLLTNNEKQNLIQKWSQISEGVHVNFLSSIEKEGPSAGTAIAVCIYSLLTNKVIDLTYAITGELTQNGYVKKIGGLEQKILGSKIQGIKHILCPSENKLDLERILKKHTDLCNDGFTVEMVNTIYDVMDKVLQKNI